MNTELTDDQILELKTLLKEEYMELRQEISQELLASDNERYIELAGLVHDMEDESVADLLVDIGLASIDRHIHALQAVDAALMRMSTGEYGLCVECGCAIGYPRLKAGPSASRCLLCQDKFEHTHFRAGKPHS